MNWNDDTNQENRDVNSSNTGLSTVLSDILEDNLDHLLEVFHPGQAPQDKSLRTARVPLLKRSSLADTVIVCPPLPNFRNLPAAMAPPLLKRQESPLLNRLAECNLAPSSMALVVRNMSSRDQNNLQPKVTSDQNVPQNQKATFEVARWLMEAIVLKKNHWPT